MVLFSIIKIYVFKKWCFRSKCKENCHYYGNWLFHRPQELEVAKQE